ncbi:1A family penicillin-binding protein [Bacillus ectoiniformans]|uniref:transglycosylase domain-containing protein n=1 Tax=Bacillus ectoiniformans TaxID=1494429 RepID=UPI001956D45F|nr:PBP1A family penicillin-binding protein [Bacillus ectoiniformans]MBM7648319.1 1A family penicillin-binding protein [Bacillus ectoiniformans]
MTVITLSASHKTIKWIRAFLFISFFLCMSLILLVGAGYLYIKYLGEPEIAVPQSTLYLAGDGSVIGESHAGEKRYWVQLDEISPALIEATLAVEDRKFFDHSGFDYKRMAGAAIADIKAMAKVQGASTITQQYARNLFLSHDKTWKRKLSEAAYTMRLEMNYSKEQILEGYLNTIYYGHGAYGIEAASQFYFAKSASQLSLAEASLLAGIPKGPGIYSPVVSLEKAKERQKLILREMVKTKAINDQQMQLASSEALAITGKHLHSKFEIAPYFRDTVQNILANKLGIDKRTIDLGGLRVYTTLNVKHQQIAEEVMKDTIDEHSDIQPGFVAISPKNHYVTAMVGGRDYNESSYNRAVQAIRQPGSTFKPFLYYAALENGFTPATTLRSEASTFRYDNGRSIYTPHNFNHRYAEKEVTMEQALAVSDNVYAVKTHLFLKPKTLVETAKRFGISTTLQKVPSLALGTSGVRVLDMVNAYATIANGGKYQEPIFIKRVENAFGEVIYEHESEQEQRFDPQQTAILTHMMTGMFDKQLSGYAKVTGQSLAPKMTRPYAGKSGSTKYDYWMIGFTPELTAGVWTGYDNGANFTKTQDKPYAKKIWIEFMERAHKGKKAKDFDTPDGVIAVNVNPESGQIAGDGCPSSRTMYFIKGTEPEEYCVEHTKKKKPKEKKAEEPGWLERWFPMFR